MKNILIAGATGLIGTELVKMLSVDNKCWILSRHNTPFDNNKNVNCIICDLSSRIDINLLPPKMDQVIFLAQANDHSDFPENAYNIININVMGMIQLLDYSVHAGVTKFILASSGGVYENIGEPNDEQNNISALSARNFYQNSKLCMEMLSKNYEQFFYVISLRIFFAYGENQKRNMLFPRLINQITHQQVISIGSINDIRLNPIYKADAANCICRVSSDIEKNCIYNISGNEIVTLSELIKIMESYIGIKAKVVFKDLGQKDFISINLKMNQELWTPQISLEEGIYRMVQQMR